MNQHDKLTGLYTREAFCYHAEMLVKQNPDIQYDIVLSDFVNFKHFNERYGTDAGDLLLIKTGEMLSMSNTNTICGRYGGDRFVSVVKHLNSTGLSFLDHFQLPESAKQELPASSIIVKFGVCSIDPSVPITVSCDRAYAALQLVKHQYGKNVAVYDDSLGEALRTELIIEESMKPALEKQEFEIYYQPKMQLHSGELNGAEALVRWNHPTLGFLSPAVFIPLFEKTGFIKEMDFHVWNKVCSDLITRISQGKKVVPVSVNLSRKDFSLPDLTDRIINLVDHYTIDHSLIHLEVTESCFADNPEYAAECLSILHDAGFIIELDDFGSGYTSLTLLNDSHLDILKLDISLLKKDNPASGRSVLSFAVKLAEMMQLTTIQEGIETREELERLKSLGVDCIQGYYYSKPLSKIEYEQFLETH